MSALRKQNDIPVSKPASDVIQMSLLVTVILSFLLSVTFSTVGIVVLQRIGKVSAFSSWVKEAKYTVRCDLDRPAASRQLRSHHCLYCVPLYRRIGVRNCISTRYSRTYTNSFQDLCHMSKEDQPNFLLPVVYVWPYALQLSVRHPLALRLLACQKLRMGHGRLFGVCTRCVLKGSL
jgi:hypothetical protein